MNINTAKHTEDGVLVNGNIHLPAGSTGYLRRAYDKWVQAGGITEGIYTADELFAKLAAEERAWRDTELARMDIELFKVKDWVFLEALVETVKGEYKPRPYTEKQIRKYRRQLRHYPDTPAFPNGKRPKL